MAKRKKAKEHELEIVGDITLPLTSDRYVDNNGEIVPNVSAIWMRFPMFEGKGMDVSFDVCNSGSSIIVSCDIDGAQTQYFSIPLEPALAQIHAIAKRRAVPRRKAVSA